MSNLVERDIAHVGLVMRASVMSCAPHPTLIDYWRNRLMRLLQTAGLADIQRGALQSLLSELAEIESQLTRMRMDRPHQGDFGVCCDSTGRL
jgi:hypothetical protein